MAGTNDSPSPQKVTHDKHGPFSGSANTAGSLSPAWSDSETKSEARRSQHGSPRLTSKSPLHAVRNFHSWYVEEKES